MEPSLHLTDAATTWGEYELYRDLVPSTKHLAFMRLVIDEQNSFTVHPNGKVTNQPKMLRPDIFPEKTAVLTSMMSVDSIYGTKGYAMPYDKTFDESTHAYNVSKCWTYETAKDVLAAARQVVDDAELCVKELRAGGESGAWDFATAGMRNPERIVVRMVCEQAAAVGSKLAEALANMVRQKKAYADMIVQFNLDFDFEGDLYKLVQFEDSYFYMNQNGDTSLPF
jgi:hypothetical protein